MPAVIIDPRHDAPSRQAQRTQLRKIRRQEWAAQPVEGTLILIGVPPGFPPFLAAVQHLPSAMRMRKAKIRVDSGGSTFDYPVSKVLREAQRLWLGRGYQGTISLSRQSEPAKGYVQGAVFPDAQKGAA